MSHTHSGMMCQRFMSSSFPARTCRECGLFAACQHSGWLPGKIVAQGEEDFEKKLVTFARKHGLVLVKVSGGLDAVFVFATMTMHPMHSASTRPVIAPVH